MLKDPDYIKKIINAGTVKRYHIVDTIKIQTTADHSWGVAMLVHYLCPTARKELLIAALLHDVTEKYIGDIPSPSKRMMKANPEIKEYLDNIEKSFLYRDKITLEQDEKTILKLADLTELLFFCKREMALGNHTDDITDCWNNGIKYISELNIKEASQTVRDAINTVFDLFIKGTFSN